MLNTKFLGWMGAGILSIGLLTGSTFAATKASAPKVDSKKPAPSHIHKTSLTSKKSSKHHSKKHLTSSKSVKHSSRKHAKSPAKTVSTKSSGQHKNATSTKKSKDA